MRYKLTTYSLDPDHRFGGPKARGFARILGITVTSIDYVETEIHAGIQIHPIAAVVENPPYGLNCVVEFPLWGIGACVNRVANLRTIWELQGPAYAPRLINAFLKV